MMMNADRSLKKEVDPNKIKILDGIDLEFILKHSEKNKYNIPQFFDKNTWKIGDTYRMRIGNIYDVSKFWIVLKEQELTLFHDYLYHFYNVNKELLRIPEENIKRNYYCVAFVEGGYYRGLTVNISHVGRVNSKAMVFLFDFGYMAAVNYNDLYYMDKNMFSIPQFSTRACLFGVEPNDADTWNSKVTNRFDELTRSKVLLCLLEVTDPIRKIVFINVALPDQFSNLTDIGELLIKEKLAKTTTLKKDMYKGEGINKLTPKTKYPFLFPSFEAIESGLMPSSVYAAELLKKCITSVILFKSYYSYNGVDLRD